MSDTVQQIKQRLDIVEVVGKYTELHKAGKNFKGKSPFSHEKTPSFYVSPDEGLYYCFSTNQGGDMFTFIQTIEGVDFKGALQQLAEQAGVELVREDPKKRDAREQQLAALETATDFYHRQLQNEPAALAYLKERGVRDDTLISWRLGYAPGPPQHGWRHLREHAKEQQFDDATLLAAGLVKQADGGKEPYDVFRHRIMFPMRNASGKVVAFSGRLLGSDENAPKYVNSPETEHYKKSELLFGYDRARDGIRKLGFSLIVEGQFDVVMCHQAGYTNTVAVSGTALTPFQVGQLERLSDKVVLALDADRAGIAAIKRSAALMLRRGMDVKVVHMEDGQDPADIIKHDPAAFKAVVGKATHVILFLPEVLRASSTDDRTFKLGVRREVIPLLASIPNRIDQEYFEAKLAELLETTKDAIHYEVERVRENANQEQTEERPAHPTPETSQSDTTKGTSTNSTDELAAYLYIASTLLDQETGKRIQTCLTDITGMPAEQFATQVSPEVRSKFVFGFSQLQESEPAKMLLSDLQHKLNYLEVTLIKRQLQAKRTALQTAEQSGDDATVETLMQEINTLQQKLSAPRVADSTFAPVAVQD